ADIWSATSWNELRREAVQVERHNLLHPEEEQRVPYVTQKLSGAEGPFVAVSDWMRSVPDQISRWVPGTYQSLGADGFGFADTRGAARRLFHIDTESIVLGVLTEKAKQGKNGQHAQHDRLGVDVEEAAGRTPRVGEDEAVGTR